MGEVAKAVLADHVRMKKETPAYKFYKFHKFNDPIILIITITRPFVSAICFSESPYLSYSILREQYTLLFLE